MSSYITDPSGFVMVRTSISHYYSSGSTDQQQPKLYKVADAKRVVNKRNKSGTTHPSDGHWEIVPVTLVFGEPLKLD